MQPEAKAKQKTQRDLDKAKLYLLLVQIFPFRYLETGEKPRHLDAHT
jgi:hypothetical protein